MTIETRKAHWMCPCRSRYAALGNRREVPRRENDTRWCSFRLLQVGALTLIIPCLEYSTSFLVTNSRRSSLSSSNALNGTVAPRIGFFHDFTERELVAYEWNTKDEILVKIQESEQIERLMSNRENLDRHLGPYPYERYRHWLSLTEKLNVAVVQRVQPEDGFVYSVCRSMCGHSEKKIHKKKEDILSEIFVRRQVQQFIPQKYPPDKSSSSTTRRGLPEMKEEPGSALRLTP